MIVNKEVGTYMLKYINAFSNAILDSSDEYDFLRCGLMTDANGNFRLEFLCTLDNGKMIVKHLVFNEEGLIDADFLFVNKRKVLSTALNLVKGLVGLQTHYRGKFPISKFYFDISVNSKPIGLYAIKDTVPPYDEGDLILFFISSTTSNRMGIGYTSTKNYGFLAMDWSSFK